MTNLGDRMKNKYENVARYYLTQRTPVIIRVDGKAFHTFTRQFKRPFDNYIINAMVYAAQAVVANAQGFKIAYIQSDEASFLLTDYDTLQTQAWFGYNKSKIETITASIMTAAFNNYIANYGPYYDMMKLAHFDARSFNIPKEEVTNYFLWRALDWERNSVCMYARAFFSHKEIVNQGLSDQHDMLHKIGKNWSTDLTEQEKNGTFILSNFSHQHYIPSYDVLSKVIDPLVNLI